MLETYFQKNKKMYIVCNVCKYVCIYSEAQIDEIIFFCIQYHVYIYECVTNVYRHIA